MIDANTEAHPGLEESNDPIHHKPHQRIFIAVHGVGNPDEGSAKSAVISALKNIYGEDFLHPNNQVLDYSWNSLVDFPVKDGRLDSKQIKKLAKAWVLASRLKTQRVKRSHEEKLENYSSYALGVLELVSHVFWFVLPVLFLVALAFPHMNVAGKASSIFLSSVLAISTLGVTAGLLAGDAFLYLIRRIVLVMLLSPTLFLLWLSSYIYHPIIQLKHLCEGSSNASFLLVFVSIFMFLNACLLSAFYVIYTLGYREEFAFAESGWYLAFLPLIFFIQPILGHLVKIIADIALYLGDDEYRNHLQNNMNQLLDTLPKNAQIILLGHSLGSVISLDSLMRSHSWRRMKDVIFVTAGSPLKRVIWRFFDGSLVGSNAHDCTERIKKNIRQFTWINVYRPLDQVGTRLDLGKGGVGEEKVMGGQWHRVLSAHVNYFGDAKVVSEVAKLISRRTIHHGKLSEFPENPAYRYALHDEKSLRSKVFNTVWSLILCFAVGLVLYTAANSFSMQSSMRSMLDPTLSSVGIEALGEAVYRRELNGRYMEDHFTFSWLHPETHTPISVNASGGSIVSPYQFNADKFISESDCEQSRNIERCIISNVVIRFLPDKPSVFILPNYPATTPRINYVLKMIAGGFATLMGAFLVIIVLYVYFNRYLSWIDETEEDVLEN